MIGITRFLKWMFDLRGQPCNEELYDTGPFREFTLEFLDPHYSKWSEEDR